MINDFDYIIIGAGTSGLTLVKELTRKNKRVLVLERGGELKYLGLLFLSPLYYDRIALLKSLQGVILYRVFGIGGTNVMNCGNAVELSSSEMDRIGINFQKELNEAKEEYKISTESFPIGRASLRIMEEANKLGYDMKVMPKFGAVNKCIACGKCVLGCRYNAKRTVLDNFENINKEKVKIASNLQVQKVLVSKGKAIGVEGKDSKFRKRKFFAEKVILAAGGIGTPVILQNSDIEAGAHLFVDLFNVTYGIAKGYDQSKEVSMSVVCDKFYEKEGFILSPFLDNFMVFLSSVKYKYFLKAARVKKMLGIMTKIKDDNIGKVYKNGKIDKNPTVSDFEKLKKGNEISKEILIKCGVNPKSIIVTKTRGSHPGGTAAIGRVVNDSLETKIKNLFVCDASVLPYAIGIPPILTLFALSKWFVRNVLEK